ncbi:unknown [Cryptobacterium sp. CAG:338]|nr:unknown [Cryptobacterium sp. CAG:338]
MKSAPARFAARAQAGLVAITPTLQFPLRTGLVNALCEVRSRVRL